MLERYKAILFDFDFTLGDSSIGIHECVNYSLSQMGYPLVASEDVRKTIGFPLKHIFNTLTGNTGDDNAREFIAHFTLHADKVITDSTVIYTGVPNVLTTLRAQGKSLGIISTKYRYRIEDILVRHSLEHHVDLIIGGEDVLNHKPHPEGIIKAMSEMSIEPTEALYVGDSIVDAELTQNAGVDFAAVLTGTTPRETFIPFEPVGIFESVTSLLSYDKE